MVLEAPTIPAPQYSRIYDSAWDINLTIPPTPTRTNTIKPIWSLQQSIVNPHTHYVCSVMDKDTGNLMSYPQLIKNPETEPRWSLAMCKELGCLSQGYKKHTEGTNTLFFMNKNAIRNIPKYCTVTYARIVVD